MKKLLSIFYRKSLADILAVFNRAKADLEAFIADHDELIGLHDEEIKFLALAKADLHDAKTEAEAVLANITKLLTA